MCEWKRNCWLNSLGKNVFDIFSTKMKCLLPLSNVKKIWPTFLEWALAFDECGWYSHIYYWAMNEWKKAGKMNNKRMKRMKMKKMKGRGWWNWSLAFLLGRHGTRYRHLAFGMHQKLSFFDWHFNNILINGIK